MLNVYEKSCTNSTSCASSTSTTSMPGDRICFVLEDNSEQVGSAEVVATSDCYYLKKIDCVDMYFDFFNRSVLFILSNKLSKKVLVEVVEPLTTSSGNERERGASRVDYYKQFGFRTEGDKYLEILSHEIVFPHECSK